MTTLRFVTAILTVALSATSVAAEKVPTFPGLPSSHASDILNGLVTNYLLIGKAIAIALFLYGAFTMVASGGKDEGYFTLSKGKKIMIASLIGLGIVYGSWMILSTVLSFVGS